MKTFSAILCGGAAVMLLSGCAGGYGQHRDNYRGGYYDGAYSGGYYDGYYGPYIGGYWSNDGYFYYLDQNRNYRRDDGRHFRHDHFRGSNPIRADDRSRDRRDQQDNRDRRDDNQ